MAPLVKALQASEQIESVVCLTGQHREMLDSVMQIFRLTGDYDLHIMEKRQTLSTITTKTLLGMDEVLDTVKPDLVLVHGDTGRIAEVIRNLIDNAVRFLPDEGGKLGLKIELTDQGRKAVSTVSNNGTPIAKEDLPHIFERFYKGEKARTRTKQSGTGLGLSIASLIIREHGGEIWAESDENSTRFSFTLNTAQINRNKH